MPFNKKKDAPAPEETPETAQAAQTEAEAEVETAAEAAQEQQAQSAEQKLQDALAKIEEYLNLAQRVQADFDNYRKRTKATRAEAFEDGAREVVKQLLPVVDNLERAIAQANEFGHSTRREVGYLTIHSVLHLLGYDHMTPGEAAVMEAKQAKALEELGITR